MLKKSVSRLGDTHEPFLRMEYTTFKKHNSKKLMMCILSTRKSYFYCRETPEGSRSVSIESPTHNERESINGERRILKHLNIVNKMIY